MKPGARAVGVAESYRTETSTLGAVVCRADRAVEAISFGTCTVGGTDASSAVRDVVAGLDRPDARYVFVAGVALAWYNVLDLEAVHDAVDRPVLAVSFEESDGLEAAITDAFDGAARAKRLRAYRALPERRPVDVDDGTVYVRALGVTDEHAAEVVRGFTFENARPEPLRVAKEAARAGDALRTDDGAGDGASSGDDGDANPSGDAEGKR